MNYPRTSLIAFVVSAALLAASALNAPAQLFVSTQGNGTVGLFDFNGATENSALLSGVTTTDIIASGSDLLVLNNQSGQVAEYSTSGTLLNASFISGLHTPLSFAISGSTLYVASNGNGTNGSISEYNVATGAQIGTSPLVTGLNSVGGIAVSGSNLYVTSRRNGTISEYNVATGAPEDNGSPLITGLKNPYGIAVSGSDIFVANHNNGTVGEYSTTGEAINSSLVSGLQGPYCIGVNGSDLYVSTSGKTGADNGAVGEYTLASIQGTVLSTNPTLISGLNSTSGIALQTQAVPEPAAWILGVGMLLVFGFLRVRAVRSVKAPQLADPALIAA